MGVRAKDRVISRKAILDAAERVFSDRGFQFARMEEIAGEAGVGAGTIYNYFKNKEELYITVIDEHFRELCENINRIIEDDSIDFSMKMRQVLEYSFQLADHGRSFMKLMFTQQAFVTSELIGTFADKGMVWYQQFLDLYARLMFKGMSEKVIRQSNPMDFAHLFLAIQHEFMHEWLFSPFEYRMTDKVPLFLDLFLHGAGARPSAASRPEE
jgi:AcrR family transcriptional regulator